MNVPVFSLQPAAQALSEDLLARWRSVLERTAFVGGPEVAAFEEAFARYLDAPGCVGVANGTDALILALRALGAGPGDEVIVPAFTFIATAEAVSLVGATPVFADIDPETLNLSPEDVATRITSRTVGIVAVHLFGVPADVDALGGLADRHGLWLMEDAAQAHGARWRGRRVGTFGRLAGWSFYPSKNLGCFGDGGAVTGADGALLDTVRRIANHGRTESYRHALVGMNSRLDGLQAAVLNLRLGTLEAGNERRRAIAARYREAFAGIDDLAIQTVPEAAQPVYHQLTLRTSRRDALQAHLAAAGIGSAIYYPIPLHRQPAYETTGARQSLPEAERASAEVLSLPMFPELSDGSVDRVCEAVRAFCGA